MKRRPEQLSMLTLMGQQEDLLRIVCEEYDRDGNCTRLVTIGRDCPVQSAGSEDHDAETTARVGRPEQTTSTVDSPPWTKVVA